MYTDFLPHCLHKFQLDRLTGGFFEVEGIIPDSMLEDEGLVNMCRFFGGDLALSS